MKKSARETLKKIQSIFHNAMKKRIVRISTICLSVVAASFVILILSLGFIVKSSVNIFVPSLTKTETMLENASISILRGRIELKNLSIGNPEGYESSRDAIKIGSVIFDISISSLLSDTIIIEEVSIRDFNVNYETKFFTSNNIEKIIENITESTSDKKNLGEEPSGKKSKKKIRINYLSITSGSISMRLANKKALSITVPLPNIKMYDIGKETDDKDEKGYTVDIIKEISNEVFSVIGDVVTKNLVDLKNAGKTVKDGATKVLEGFKDLFD